MQAKGNYICSANSESTWGGDIPDGTGWYTGQFNWNDVKAITLLFLNETHFFNFCRYPLNRHFLYSHINPKNLSPVWHSGAGKQGIQHPQHMAWDLSLGQHQLHRATLDAFSLNFWVPDKLIGAKKSPKWVTIFSEGWKVSTERHEILKVPCLGFCGWWS